MSRFRKATSDDFSAICRLIKSKEELYLVYPSGTYPFTVDQLKDLSKRRNELTVMVENKDIIAFANFYNYEPNKSAYIGNVIIAKKYRGRGFGKEIISHMLRIAKEKYNLKIVKISVFSDNISALLLYSGFGFSPYEVEERKNINGNRVAIIHLEKKL